MDGNEDKAFSRAYQFPHSFWLSMTSSWTSLTRFNTAPQPGGPPVKKEKAFEGASGTSGTLERRDALGATCCTMLQVFTMTSSMLPKEELSS